MLAVVLLASSRPLFAQLTLVHSISTVAGQLGVTGSSGDGGSATRALLDLPTGVARDRAGNLYIPEFGSNRIRKVNQSTGTITTIAGTGAGFSGDGGPAINAQLNGPRSITLDAAGNIYFVDSGNARIREISAADGTIQTVAGNGTPGNSGDGGLATKAQLFSPQDVAADAAGDLYISDNPAEVIRRVSATTGIITTVAGTGKAGFSGDGGPAGSASLSSPKGLAVDNAGNLFIADSGNARIRMVSATTGVISTIAGNGNSGDTGDGGPAKSAQLHDPQFLTIDGSGNLYIAGSDQVIRKVNVATGIITTVTGSGTIGSSRESGTAGSAELHSPTGNMATDNSGNLYFADAGNGVVREVSAFTPSSTNIGSSSTQNLLLQTTVAETITSFTVPVSEGNKREYTVGTVTGCVVDGATSNPAGTVCTIPITFSPAYPGPRPIPLQAVTSAGNINIGMNGTGLGPQLALTPGILSTLAGTSSSPNTNGDGGPAIDATIFGTSDITIDSIGNIYLADIGGQEVRKIDASTGIISRIAGQGTSGYGYGGDGGPAINSFLNAPQDVALDSANNLYIADRQNHVVRKIDGATGIISTVAGQYYSSFTLQPPSDGDGGPATQALLNEPTGLAFDSAGNLYIADAAGSQIRKVDAVTNTISTVAGTGARGYTGDGGPATSAVLDLPEGVAVDQAGNVYFTDDQNSVVRRVDAVTGIITTYAGNPNIPLNQNILLSGPATSINIAATYIKFDAAGNLYITGNDAVRRVDAVTKIMTSIASGQTDEDYGTVSAGDGYPAIGYPNAGFDNPVGIAIDSSGSLLINDNAYLRKVDTTTSAVYFLQPTALSTLDAANDPQTVNVGNIGNAALTLPALGSGTNATVSPASFLFDSTLSNSCPQVSSGSSPATVAPGDSCDLALDFQPLVSGKITGSLVLTDNTLNSGPTTSTAYAVQSIPVQGIGTGGATLLPNALNFGNVAVGTSSATQTATLTNADPSYALYLSAPSLTDSTDFTESDNCNSLVPANASCTLTFTFTPQSAGALSSTFTISDSAHGTHYSIALAGDGISASAPQALLSPGTLSFTTTAGTAAATQMATLTNKGTAALALSSIAITGTNSTAFAQTNTCGSSLAAGASCTVTVSFTATSTGSYSATLTATDNASPATQSIQLTALVTTGSTGAPAATLTPATLNFGSVQTGAKSTAQSATLTNAGDAALTITSVSLMGTNSAAFATTNTCGSTLAAGASCAISVTFDPTTAGTDGATLSVSDNAPGSPQTSSLVGVATAPPAAADFSIAATPASQSVTSGSSAVYQVNLASLNGAFTQPVTLAASGLPAGSTVSFSPTSVTPGSAGSSSTMTIQTTAQQAFVQEDRVRWPISAGLVSVALLILPFRRRKRIFLGLGCLLLVLGVSGVMTACGGGFALPQVKATSATYTVTVTGTSGSLQHSTSVQITVR